MGINGTFFWQGYSVGIAVNDYKRLDVNSHVANFDFIKRGTIYYKDDKMYCERVWDIRDIKPQWAISGIMLYPDYDPTAEGFVGAYSDVLRKCNHSAIGFKNNDVYLIACENMYLKDFRSAILNSSVAFDGLINLDGGGSTQLNCNGKGIKSSRKVVSAVIVE